MVPVRNFAPLQKMGGEMPYFGLPIGAPFYCKQFYILSNALTKNPGNAVFNFALGTYDMLCCRLAFHWS